MGLTGATVAFRGVSIYQRRLAMAYKDNLAAISKEIELILDPPRSYQLFSYFGY
jgi:hypothetical protein